MYTVDVAGWHLIALNSNAQIGPARINKEVSDLQADLARTPASRCTLAYFHHPVQNAGPEGEPIPGSLAARLWSALAGKADIVLNGHDHSYQRFKPVSGTTELVVGTTGHSGQAPVPDPRLVTFFGNLFGALRAELNPHGFGFRFIDEDGVVLDSGAIPCAGAADTAAPATPTGLVEGSVSRTAAEIRWQTPTDDVGVTGYDVLRDGTVIGSTSGDTRFLDSSVQAGTAYVYRVRARDRAGHLSAQSAPLVVLPNSVVFLDTFESGNLAAWTTRVGAVAVTTAAAHVGGNGLRVSAAGGLAYVSKTLVTTFGTLEALVHVRIDPVLNPPANSQVNLVTFSDGAGLRIVTVFRQKTTRRLCYSTGAPAVTTCQSGATPRIDDGGWHVLRVRATTGASPALTLQLDDNAVPGLGGTPALGSNPIARLVIGSTAPQTFQADFDQVAADPLPIGDLIAPTAPPAITAQAVSGLQVNVAWAASTDDVGVAGYHVFRNGLPVGTTAGTGFIDRTVDGLASYTYTVRARDAAGNVSPPSLGASVDTPIVLRERFDTAAALKRFAPAAGLGWDAASKALRLRSNAHGRIALPGATSRLYARIKFRIVTRGANAVPLLSLRSATGAVLSTGLDASGALGATRPASAQWHDLQVHADVATRVSQVFLDGEERTELTRQLAVGLPAITAIELGGAGTFDVLVDDLEANTTFMTDTVRPGAPRVSGKVVRSRTVSLSWTAATDDIGVAGYRILRGTVEIGRTTGSVRKFVDRAAPPGARVTYGVRAVDAAGNLSATAKKIVRVPWLADPRRRLVRAKRTVRLALPAAHRSVILSLRVRPRATPRRAIVARLGATLVRFPKAARTNRWITIRVRVKRPGTVLRLGGSRSFDFDRVVVQ
jgi:chitodextrinase